MTLCLAACGSSTDGRASGALPVISHSQKRVAEVRAVIIDLTVLREVAAFAKWSDRWRDQVVVSGNEGCGCCIEF